MYGVYKGKDLTMPISARRIQDTKQSKKTPKKMSPAERDRVLWEASRRYMRGQITENELEEIERSVSETATSSSQ